ncbi:MAG: amino acid racemase [Clostridiales bacterium]|nr:amino acid racemase [Clostridiales bacterium]
MKKTIGILGGMGPEATAYFFSLIIKQTAAAKDQDHIPILIYNNPRIPPRTDALLGKGPSPVRLLKEGAKKLERAGAHFIVMPCITAHAFLSPMRSAVKIPVLDIIEETAAWAKKKIPRLKRAGLVASTGTVKSGLFRDAFDRVGVKIVAPTDREQEKVMEAIFGPAGTKAGVTEGQPRRLLLSVAKRLIRRGAGAIIAGCTEVPLVLKDEDIPVPLIEPMRIAAERSIILAGYRVKK